MFLPTMHIITCKNRFVKDEKNERIFMGIFRNALVNDGVPCYTGLTGISRICFYWRMLFEKHQHIGVGIVSRGPAKPSPQASCSLKMINYNEV